MRAGAKAPRLCASKEICVVTILGTQTNFPFHPIHRAGGDKGRGVSWLLLRRKLNGIVVNSVGWHY